MPRLAAALAVAALLGGCATYTGQTSPCACDWRPLGAAEEAVA